MLSKQGIVLQVAEDLWYLFFYYHLSALHIFVMCQVPGELGGYPQAVFRNPHTEMGELASERERGSPKVTQLVTYLSSNRTQDSGLCSQSSRSFPVVLPPGFSSHLGILHLLASWS